MSTLIRDCVVLPMTARGSGSCLSGEDRTACGNGRNEGNGKIGGSSESSRSDGGNGSGNSSGNGNGNNRSDGECEVRYFKGSVATKGNRIVLVASGNLPSDDRRVEAAH